jgi:hypothetical protein
MTYRGHVENGVVVLDERVELPEGLQVQVVLPVPAVRDEPLLDENGETLGQKLLRFAGRAEGMPEDAATNLDHYLYGTPKS